MAGAARRRLILASVLLLGLWPGIARAAESVTAEHGVAAGGNISNSSITIGLTPKEVQELIQSEAGKGTAQIVELATRLGVTQGAVTTFLRTLGEKDVPIEELPAKLGEIAERHKALLAQIASVRMASPDVQAIKDQAHAAVERGDYEPAESLLSKAEDAALASADQLRLDAAALRAERGGLAFTRLDYRAAAEHFATAASLVPLAEALVRADDLNREGRAADEAANYSKAEAILADSLQLREAHLAADDPDLGVSLNNLALVYQATGRYAEAEPLYQRAAKIWETALGADHPNVATALNNLALVYQATGRYAEAEPLHQRADKIWETALGPDHPNVAFALNNLATMYQATGRYTAAESLYERAIAIDEKALGPDHPNTRTFRLNLEMLKQAPADQKRAVTGQ